VAKRSYQESPRLSALEDAVVDLVRLGAAGDASSVSQLGRRILRRHTDGATDPAAFREALGTALVAAGHAPTRTAPLLRAPTDSESHLPLASVESTVESAEPLLIVDEREAIQRLLEEHVAVRALEAAGLAPTRSVLISGPPGVGKTMTARYIAASLKLPLVTVDLAGLMSSLLGRTGQNLRQALDYARSFRCVLLLDEFDALAKRRDDSSDVGELKRIVNVLLLELERWPVGNLLIAATNHPELLDRAVGRRFDAEVELSLPDLPTRAAILRRTLDDLGQRVSGTVIGAAAVATDGWSGSDIDRLLQTSIRRAVLNGEQAEVRLAHDVMEPLRNSSHGSPPSRAAFCAIAVEQLGMSQRAVAAMLGVSHPTVGKLLKKWAADSQSSTDRSADRRRARH
jgi:ATPase family associated with various cellular activities (AAA)/Homeodomain-like domain